MQLKPFIKPLLALAPLLLGACALFPLATATPAAPGSPGMIHTAAAQTIVAQVTQAANETAVAQLTRMASGGLPAPSATGAVASPTPPAPLQATPWAPDTPWPTWTAIAPLPGNTPQPWSPPAPPPQPAAPCDAVQFVRDVSVPDGSVFYPGQPFTKVWRLRNNGACNWTTGYSLVFVNGDRMQQRSAYPMPGLVRPGQYIDIGADFVAPSQPGRYRGYWMLSNAYGQVFGLGPDAQKAFWVDIVVEQDDDGGYSGEVFDFANHLCEAQWSNGRQALPCPGDPDSGRGAVVYLPDPVLETGKHENEPAIWTRPETGHGGMISGIFPPYRVQAGDHFMSDIGCMSGSKRCDVVFYLDYRAANGSVHNLGSWHEVYDRMIYRVDVDLSGLAGKKVQLILRVENAGDPEEADALWLMPGVYRGWDDGPSPWPNPWPTHRPWPPVPQEPSPTPGGPWPPSNPEPGYSDQPAILAAIKKLAHDLGIPKTQVVVTLVEQATWPDACLGIYIDGQSCAQVVIPGYRIMLAANGQRFEAHTDQAGATVIWVQIY